MILDKRTTLADNVALNTGAAGTYNVGDQYDTQLLASDVGEGQTLFVVIDIGTAATSGGAATGQFQIVSDAQVPIEDDGTQTVHVVSPAIAVADLVANSRVLAVSLPKGTYERFIGLQQITGVAAFTGGTVKCFMTFDVNAFRAYVAGTTN